MSATPARRAAFELVRRVFEDGAWANRAFPAIAERARLDGRERAQAQRLAYAAVQRRGTSDHLIGALAERAPEELDAPVLAALRLGLCELLFAATPGRAAVHQAVELAKSAVAAEHGGGRAEAAAGLVNAVLRRAARERAELLAGLDDATPRSAAIAHSCPEWLARMWWAELGPRAARGLMRAANEPPETALRVNTLAADPESLLRGLAEAGEPVERPRAPAPLAPPEALVVSGPLSARLRARIAAGELIAQARASQAVVDLLGPRAGERVLDLCAGPGIKTTQVVARAGNRVRVVALELDAGRARQVKELCERLGARGVEVRRADATVADLGEGYDRVLVDPPCSDLGTLASRPDLRWRKSPAAIADLAATQATLLARGVGALRPGGTLVYSTCTISERENERVVQAVLGADRALDADDLGSEYPALASSRDARFLETRPDRDRTDGFFIARLRRAGG